MLLCAAAAQVPAPANEPVTPARGLADGGDGGYEVGFHAVPDERAFELDRAFRFGGQAVALGEVERARVAVGGDEVQVIDDILYVNGKAQPRADHNNDRSILDDIEDSKEHKLLYRENLEGKEHWTMQDIPSMRRVSHGNWPASHRHRRGRIRAG